mmetsp:Transcript_5018/g.13626  ORF Transcript_5018/g.13626 Transcript_5018/m.13626 type:complete len:327 (-) Transcript_5018:1717-2697(-)
MSLLVAGSSTASSYQKPSVLPSLRTIRPRHVPGPASLTTMPTSSRGRGPKGVCAFRASSMAASVVRSYAAMGPWSQPGCSARAPRFSFTSAPSMPARAACAAFLQNSARPKRPVAAAAAAAAVSGDLCNDATALAAPRLAAMLAAPLLVEALRLVTSFNRATRLSLLCAMLVSCTSSSGSCSSTPSSCSVNAPQVHFTRHTTPHPLMAMRTGATNVPGPAEATPWRDSMPPGPGSTTTPALAFKAVRGQPPSRPWHKGYWPWASGLYREGGFARLRDHITVRAVCDASKQPTPKLPGTVSSVLGRAHRGERTTGTHSMSCPHSSSP